MLLPTHEYLHNLNRKIFNHQLVNQVELLSEDTVQGRYYTTPEGIKLPSVTTVLSQKLDNTWIIEWKRRIGEREAKRISEMATRRGSIIHGICERYVANEKDYLKGVMPVHQIMFSTIKKVLDEHVNDVYGIEIPLYSLTLNCAGRTDLVAKYNGVPSIIDYKTSKKIKTEGQILSYFLQSTVYSMLFEKTYRISVPQIVIIIAVDDENKPLIFVKNRGLFVKKVLEIFT